MNNLKNKLAKIKEEASKVAKLKESVEKNYDILKESLLLRLVEKRIDEEEALKKMNTYNCIKLLDGVVCANIKITETQEKEKQYPVNFESWHDVEADQLRFLNKIHRQIEELKSIFSK